MYRFALNVFENSSDWVRERYLRLDSFAFLSLWVLCLHCVMFGRNSFSGHFVMCDLYALSANM